MKTKEEILEDLKSKREQLLKAQRENSAWKSGKYKNHSNATMSSLMVDSIKEKEEIIIISVEEMEKNYEKQIDSKPLNDPLTGKISIVVDWINQNYQDAQNIEYIQWYKPYPLKNCWNCRLEFSIKNSLGNYVKEDKVFKIKNNLIIEVINTI